MRTHLLPVRHIPQCLLKNAATTFQIKSQNLCSDWTSQSSFLEFFFLGWGWGRYPPKVLILVFPLIWSPRPTSCHLSFTGHVIGWRKNVKDQRRSSNLPTIVVKWFISSDAPNDLLSPPDRLVWLGKTPASGSYCHVDIGVQVREGGTTTPVLLTEAYMRSSTVSFQHHPFISCREKHICSLSHIKSIEMISVQKLLVLLIWVRVGDGYWLHSRLGKNKNY